MTLKQKRQFKLMLDVVSLEIMLAAKTDSNYNVRLDVTDEDVIVANLTPGYEEFSMLHYVDCEEGTDLSVLREVELSEYSEYYQKNLKKIEVMLENEETKKHLMALCDRALTTLRGFRKEA